MMLRISLSLHVDPDFPDDRDEVTYFDSQPWFTPTPPIIGWLGELLNKFAKSTRLPDATPEQHAELRRMRATHNELVSMFGIGPAKRPEYYSPSELKQIDNLLSNPSQNIAHVPGPVIQKPTAKKPGKYEPGKILAWRPQSPSDGVKIIGGQKKDEADDFPN